MKFRIGQIWYSPVLEDIVEIIGINDRFYLDIMFELKGNESTYDMPKDSVFHWLGISGLRYEWQRVHDLQTRLLEIKMTKLIVYLIAAYNCFIPPKIDLDYEVIKRWQRLRKRKI